MVDVLAELESALAPENATEKFMKEFCENYLADMNKIEAMQEITKEQYKAIMAGYDSQMSQIQFQRGNQFRLYVEQLTRGTGKKSINFFSGKAGMKKSPEKIIVNDEKAAVAWAKDNCPAAVKVEESILKKPLMEKFTSEGELPPGCEYIEAADKFFPWIDKLVTITEETESEACNV